MTRQIIFRGKRTDNGEWVEGLLLTNKLGSYIVTEQNPHECHQNGYIEIDEYASVAAETVGQFTGLTDKNGAKIYEGDIVFTPTEKHMVISWSQRFASYVVDRDGWAFSHWFGESVEGHQVEVVGNVHDNPELLKGG